MTKNAGFCMYFDWVEDLNYLPPEDAWKIVRALSAHYTEGANPIEAVDGALKAIVSSMYNQIKRSEAKAAAGAKGAAATNAQRVVKREVADGTKAAECEVADGMKAAGCEVADGTKAAECEVADGTKAAECEVADGMKAAECEVADGMKAAECEVADGTNTNTYTNTNTKTNTYTDTPPPPPTPPDAKSITPKAETGRGTGRTILSRFDEFWEAYPKKAGINEAKRAFLQLGVTDRLLSEMLEAIRRQVGSEQWTRDGGRFIPYPATWLSRGQWKDVPLLRRSGAASGDSGGSHSHGVSGGSGAASGYYGAASGEGTQGGGGTIGGIAGFEAIHGGGGFDTDSFYAAALRRSYGDLCEELSCLPSVKPKDAG